MQEVTKINSKKEIFDIKMTLKLIKMNENAIDKSLLKIKKAANFDNGFRFKVQKLLIKLKSQSKSHVKSHYDSHVIFFIKLFILLILGNNYNIEMIENHIANHRVNHI